MNLLPTAIAVLAIYIVTCAGIPVPDSQFAALGPVIAKKARRMHGSARQHFQNQGSQQQISQDYQYQRRGLSHNANSQRLFNPNLDLQNIQNEAKNYGSVVSRKRAFFGDPSLLHPISQLDIAKLQKISEREQNVNDMGMRKRRENRVESPAQFIKRRWAKNGKVRRRFFLKNGQKRSKRDNYRHHKH